MVYIILSVIGSTLIFIALRLFIRFRIDNWQAITINYLIAALLSFALNGQFVSPQHIVSSHWFAFALLLGALFTATFFFFALSSQKVGVAVTSVTSKMSVVIPVSLGVILLNENLSMGRLGGILLALLAFYLVFRTREGTKIEARWALLPLLVFLGNGLVDSTMKYTEQNYARNDLLLFLASAFFTSFILGTLILTLRFILGKAEFAWRNVVGGIILGLLNFGSTYYILRAMANYESSVVFPLSNAAIVGLSSIAGFFGFREKLTFINWAGILLAIISILIIANA